MPTEKKIVAIIQARMGSSRLPGKVLADICGKPLLVHIVERLALARSLDEVWVATSVNIENDAIEALMKSNGIPVFRGGEDDVLGRYCAAARAAGASIVVRICGDCPMIDPAVVDLVVEEFVARGVDYACNTLERSYPDGIDVEVVSLGALEIAEKEATHPFHRLHVTPYIHGRLKHKLPAGKFKLSVVKNELNFGHIRLTVDSHEDLEFVRRLMPHVDTYHWMDAVAALTRHPGLLAINANHAVYEGSERDLLGSNRTARLDVRRSNELFESARKVIPLASQTFSKSHQQWVRGASPLFGDRGFGCRIVDIDGNAYIDYVLALMPVVLGYCDPDVDDAIRKQLGKGIIFSLSSPLEYELAQRLTSLIPAAEMVRFGKNGSDATSAAVRLARAYTGRDRIVVCGGYHGWHDWYIGTTTRNLGVPKAVAELSQTIPFNDLDRLATALANEPGKIAAVIVEPAGGASPAPGYLEAVRKLTADTGTVLIFDEIITGFRIHLGGAQAYYGVTPDLACFGKSMANGMPISAVVGRGEIMKKMEDIFFSGTFGGEALSLAASIATIDKLQRENVVARVWNRGTQLRDQSNKIIAECGLTDQMAFTGDGWWPRLQISATPEKKILFTSLLRQELVANGLLFAQSFNLSLSHDDDDVEAETMRGLSRALAAVQMALQSSDPSRFLRGHPIQPTFSVR